MSKDKTFQCNILDYVERKKPEVFKAISELCLKGAFKPRRDTGVTFIMPTDATIKAITPGIYSDKEDEYEKAWSTMQAHILNDCYESVAEFKDSDVSNRLNKKVEFSSVAGTKAVLKNGTELTLDASFKMIPGRKGLSIFNASGPMPTDGPDASPRSRGPKAEGAGKKKTVGRGPDEFNRVEFVKKIESSYMEKNDGICYLQAVLALLDHLGKNAGSKDYKRAVVSLDKSPYASLYILLEPYHAGKMLLSPEVLDAWTERSSNLTGEKAVEAYIAHLSKGADLLSKDLDDKIDSARWTIISGGFSRHNLPKSIGSQYNQLVPHMYAEDSLKEFFTPEYKEWQDLARYHINYMFSYCESSIGNHVHDFKEVQSSIQAIMGGDERFSTKIWSPLAGQSDFLAGPISFITSGSFLYYPCEKKHVKGADDDDSDLPAQVYAAAEDGTGSMDDLKASAGCCT